MSKLQRQITAFDPMVKFVIVFVGMMCCAQFTQAQVKDSVQIKDPLEQPAIWNQLRMDPHNDDLWSLYFKQDLFVLSKEDYLNYNKWKSYLVNRKQSEIEQRELELMRKREEYFEKRYSHKEKKTDLEHLTQNIQKNFAIIEQYFEEQFDLMGEIYEPYYSVHKDQKYSKIKWVEEHETLLRELQEEM